jgi:methylmalonyl-CoA/ethylmalonyl-CoA epimerase
MNLQLHHIGVVVADIATAAAHYVTRLGYSIASEIIHDPTQTAHVQFLRLAGDSSFLELVSPDGPTSKLAQAVAKGGGLNHLCYATAEIDITCAEMKRNGFVLLQAPVAATAFPGRRIAWLIGKDRIPIELVERGLEGML